MSFEMNITNTSGDYEDIGLIDADGTGYENERLHRHIFRYLFTAVDLIKFIVFILALASDIYLIIVISKFKNLKTRTNYFILQYVIFNMLYLVLKNLLLIILYQLPLYAYDYYCFVSNLDHLTGTLSYYVLTFMAFDWYIQNYHSSIYDRYPQFFKYGACILYLFALPKWIATSVICLSNEYTVHKIRLHLEMVSFLFCFITVMGITVLKRHKAPSSEAYKTEYALSIPRTILLLALCWYVVYLISEFIPYFYLAYTIERFMFNLAECIVLAAPIIVLYQLSKTNKYFKMAYIRCCRRKKVKNYDDDNLDAESLNEVSETNVAFDKNNDFVSF